MIRVWKKIKWVRTMRLAMLLCFRLFDQRIRTCIVVHDEWQWFLFRRTVEQYSCDMFDREWSTKNLTQSESYRTAHESLVSLAAEIKDECLHTLFLSMSWARRTVTRPDAASGLSLFGYIHTACEPCECCSVDFFSFRAQRYSPNRSRKKNSVWFVCGLKKNSMMEYVNTTIVRFLLSTKSSWRKTFTSLKRRPPKLMLFGRSAYKGSKFTPTEAITDDQCAQI